MDFVSQRELRALKQTLRRCDRIADAIAGRVSARVYVEPGPLSFEAGRVISSKTKAKLNRIRIMARLFDPGDFEFISRHGGVARKFRKDRALVFSLYLQSAKSELWESYRIRLDHIREAGSWSRDYPDLMTDTARAVFSILKLRIALVLFVLRLPGVVSIAANVERVLTYASAQPSCAKATS